MGEGWLYSKQTDSWGYLPDGHRVVGGVAARQGCWRWTFQRERRPGVWATASGTERDRGRAMAAVELMARIEQGG